jgi:flavin reductase (DIM6/NTAB) family NADH-FMN oxidoreductase RutF
MPDQLTNELTHQRTTAPSADFAFNFFPVHLSLLSCGENMMPLGYWTLISREPFRLLISMSVSNYTLTLLRKYHEAVLHFFPWRMREMVVRAGHMTGRDSNKADRIGFILKPADKLQHTRLVAGFEVAYEMVVWKELEGLATDHAQFVFDVVAVHEAAPLDKVQPILFMGEKNFAALGERWRFSK